MGKGGAKRRQKSAGFFLFLHFCTSQGQTQSRPDPDVPHLGTRPSPLHDQGDSGPGQAGLRRNGLQPAGSPCNRSSMPSLCPAPPPPRTRETWPSWAHMIPCPHPRTLLVCPKKPLPLANKLSCIFPFSTLRSNVFQEFNYV